MPFNPFSVLTSKIFTKIFGALSIVLLLACAFLWNRWDHWKAVADKLAEQAGRVVFALEQASGEEVDWKTAPGRIVVLGESNRLLKDSIAVQNRAIDDMAREAVRLRARAAELKLIADKAQAPRRAALTRLSDMTITPGTRADCMTLLREADEALNLVRKAGA